MGRIKGSLNKKHKQCLVGGCDKPHNARSMCAMHYRRWMFNGDPNVTRMERHGMRHTTEYTIWSGIITRCTNPRVAEWMYYGGRGINVCDGIRKSFSHFYATIGDRVDNLTIDRIDNDRGYTCGTCADCLSNGYALNMRWATMKEQAANRRRKVTEDIPIA